MLTHKPWSEDTLLLLLLRLFVAFGMLVLAAAVGDRLYAGQEEEARRFWISSVGGGLMQISAILLVALFLRENHLDWEAAFGLRWSGAGRQIGLGILVAFVVFFAAQQLMTLSQWLMESFDQTPKAQAAIEALRSHPDWRRQVAVALTAVVLAPVLEELIFRGVLLVSLRQAGYPRLAFWGTALLFSVTHLNTVTFLPLLFFAMTLNAVYLRTGSLLAPITAHALFNAANFVLVVLSGAQ